MRCELQGVVHTASRVVKRDDELGTEGRAELDADLLVDILGDPEIDEVEFPRLRGVGEREAPGQTHLDI